MKDTDYTHTCTHLYPGKKGERETDCVMQEGFLWTCLLSCGRKEHDVAGLFIEL